MMESALVIRLTEVKVGGVVFFFQAEDGIRDLVRSRGLGDVYKRQVYETAMSGHHAYFDAAVMLAFFLLLGRYLDHRTLSLIHI